jgi:hypothetical protein
LLFAQAGLDLDPPILHSRHHWDGRCVPPHQLFSVEIGSHKLFAQSGFKP